MTSLTLAENLSQVPHALTVAQVAQLLSINKLTVYRLCSKGILPHFRIGSIIRFDPRTTAEYLHQHQIGGAQ